MKISYCSSCKGRLSQLEQTIAANLHVLKNNPNLEWIILDYYCPDNTASVLMEREDVLEAMANGQLKIFKLNTDVQFSMPLAKNLSHSLATGDILFNLDIDNYIGVSPAQLRELKDGEFMWSRTGLDNGTMGRIGLHKNAFLAAGGYDLDLFGAGCDDKNIAMRLRYLGYKDVCEKYIFTPIQNTEEQTAAYLPETGDRAFYFAQSHALHVAKMKRKEFVANNDHLTTADGVDILSLIDEVSI